jgi:Icc-related predicted phosphoesterase
MKSVRKSLKTAWAKGASLLLATVMVLLLFGCSQPPATMTLVQLCDPQLGFGEDGFEADVTRLEKAVIQINELAPDVVVVAGDMVNDIGDAQAIATVVETLARIKAPVLLTPGNHDLPDPVTAARLERYRASFGKDFNTLECKGRQIVSANSQLWREAPPEESARNEQQLRDALQKAKKKGQPVILLTHVPPFVTSVDEKDEYFNLPESKRHEILRLCEDNGVIIWLAGHTHNTSRRSYNDIAILNGEATSRNFDRHPAGFRLLTIYPDNHFDWEFNALN